MPAFRWPVFRLLCLSLLALALLGAAPADHAGLPVYASPEEALRAALEEYELRVAPGRSFRLGPVHRLGPWAYALAQEVDAQGRPASERQAGLLAHQEEGGWVALAPGLVAASDYNALLSRFPHDLLDPGYQAYLRQPERPVRALATYGGYRLPWPAGQIGYVTQKDVAPHHMNQVDFDIRGLAAAGDVYAAKPGRVVFVREDSTTGSCGGLYKDTNLVVIEHGPAEYSWYLHLAPYSVPVQVGDWVGWGAKIGVEGNTGNSCGVHVHFMVSTSHTAWTWEGHPDYLPWPAGGQDDMVAVDFVESPWAALTEYGVCNCYYYSTNASSLNTGTPTPTTTPLSPTPTPTATPVVGTSCQEVLRNGGFEDDSAWSFPPSGVRAGFSTREVRTGARSLRLGIEGDPPYYAYSSADQALTLPAGPASATLSFWYRVVSSDPSGGQAYVLIRGADQVYRTLGFLSVRAQGWTPASFDTSAYLGEAVTVRLTAVNGTTGGAVAVYIDDASWRVCSDASPTFTPTPTPTVTATNTPTPSPTATASPAPTATATPTSAGLPPAYDFHVHAPLILAD